MKIIIEMTQEEIKQLISIVEEDAPVQEKTESMTLEEFTAPKYTLKEVRAKLATLESSKAKELIASFGVNKLTDLPEEHYSAIMQKAGEV